MTDTDTKPWHSIHAFLVCTVGSEGTKGVIAGGTEDAAKTRCATANAEAERLGIKTRYEVRAGSV